MKKRFYLTMMLLSFVFLLGSCSRGPERVAKDFYNNLNHGKLDDAKKDCTDATKSFVEMAASFGGNNNFNQNYKAEVTKSEINGDFATVWIKDANNPQSTEEDVQLRKIDGKWKVNIKK